MKLILERWQKFVNEVEAKGAKPKLIFLIGPPAVGKSTWIRQNLSSDYLVLNRDDIVEKVAKESGVGTYDDMYKRPPKEILPDSPLPSPENPQKVKQYLTSLKVVADKFNKENPEQTRQFGPVAPFESRDYIQALTPRTEVAFIDDDGKEQMGWGVPAQYLVPLYYPKIKTANETIKKQFEEARTALARDKKDVVIDMVNMSLGERDGHRLEMAKAISETPVDNIEEARQIINEKFDQEAYVFSNSLEGWSDEEREKVKQIAVLRAKEIAAEPGRSKTIPPQAYDRFFSQYSPPSKPEGYTVMEYVGIPSLQRLDNTEAK